MNEREALERIAKYPMSRGEEMSIETAREIAREALASQAQQSPKMQFLDRSKEKIITLLWQGICDGTVEAFDVNGMMVIPSEQGVTYVRKEDVISFFGLVEPSQAQQESQWISVEERLPEGDVFVDVYIRSRSNTNFMQRETSVAFVSGKFKINRIFDCEYVSHWMPIPPAPEGGE
jgi:hypothetical protein